MGEGGGEAVVPGEVGDAEQGAATAHDTGAQHYGAAGVDNTEGDVASAASADDADAANDGGATVGASTHQERGGSVRTNAAVPSGAGASVSAGEGLEGGGSGPFRGPASQQPGPLPVVVA